MRDKANSGSHVAANVRFAGAAQANAHGGGVYRAQCFSADGRLKWEVRRAENLVMDEGLKYKNDQFFSGSGYTAVWYLGLIEGPGPTTIAGADTLASNSWNEFTNYAGARKAVSFGASSLADPSIIDNSGAPAVFSITSTGGTVAGAFLTDVDSGTSGILFSASDFEAPGDRSVVLGDTINVTYEFSLTAT